MQIETAVTGKIDGDATIKGVEKWHEIHEVEYSCEVPIDAGAGGARGRVAHKAVKFRVNMNNPGVPLFFQALVKNEKIKNFELRFMGPDSATGKNTNHTSIVLTGGVLSLFKMHQPNTHAGIDANNQQVAATMPSYVEIHATFEEFTLENKVAKKVAAHKWNDQGIG